MAAWQETRRWACAAACVAVVASGFVSPALTRAGGTPRPAAGATVVPIVSPVTLVTPEVASNPSVSENGQFVVYVAAPSGEGRTSSVWLSDRLTGTISELTLPRDGTRLGNSVNPVISADGCTVAVTTEIAYDLFRDDDEGSRWDTYRTTVETCGGTPGDWAIVSTYLNVDGQATARNDVDPDEHPAISSSGSIVAYVRPFESLSDDDDPDEPHASIGAIDVVDLSVPIDAVGHTVEAPGLPSAQPTNAAEYAGQIDPALSADGSTLVFTSDATSNLAVADWTAPVSAATSVTTQVFAWNRNDGDPFTAVALLSAGTTGPGNASSSAPTISADGSVVAFVSAASNLVSATALAGCGSLCPSQVYALDRDPDENSIDDEAGVTSMTLLSRAPAVDGEPLEVGNGASFAPALSADGISVVFASQASNLVQVQAPGNGQPGDGDLLIADLANGQQLRRAFDRITPVAGAHGNPRISANGRVVVADSLVADRLLADPGLAGRHIVAATYRPTLSVGALDFGTIVVSVPGPEWEVNVVNLGPGAFTPVEVTIDNPDFTLTGGSCINDRAPIQPGTSCSITIVFIPSVAGPRAAALTIAETGFEAVVLTAPVRGTGGEPAIDALPDWANYGTAVVGRLSPFTEVFRVSNVSVLPTVVASATMSGANPDDFLVTASTCGRELLLGVECPVEVSFRPTGSGRRTATLNFRTFLGQYTSVLLSGEGVYEPRLLTSVSLVPGDELGVGGTGFPAGTEVLVGWSDGRGRSAVATTDKSGGFLLNLTTLRTQRAGSVALVARAADGTSATAEVIVERTPRRAPRQRP